MKTNITTQNLIEEIKKNQDFLGKVIHYKNNSFYDFVQKMILMMDDSAKRDLSQFRFTYSIVFKGFSLMLKDKGLDIKLITAEDVEQSISDSEFLSALLLITDFGKNKAKIDKEKFNKTFMKIGEVSKKTKQLKEDFIADTGYSKDISDVDFLGVVLMTPALAIAMADGVIDHFENRYLAAKGREHSQGKYMPFMDPVVNTLEFLADKLDTWERPFLEMNRFIMEQVKEHETEIRHATMFDSSETKLFDGPKRLIDKEFDVFFEELLDIAEKLIFKIEFGIEMQNVTLPKGENVPSAFQFWDLTMESMKWDMAGLALPYFIGESIVRSLFFRKSELKPVEKKKVSEIIEILGFDTI